MLASDLAALRTHAVAVEALPHIQLTNQVLSLIAEAVDGCRSPEDLAALAKPHRAELLGGPPAPAMVEPHRVVCEGDWGVRRHRLPKRELRWHRLLERPRSRRMATAGRPVGTRASRRHRASVLLRVREGRLSPLAGDHPRTSSLLRPYPYRGVSGWSGQCAAAGGYHATAQESESKRPACPFNHHAHSEP